MDGVLAPGGPDSLQPATGVSAALLGGRFPRCRVARAEPKWRATELRRGPLADKRSRSGLTHPRRLRGWRISGSVEVGS